MIQKKITSSSFRHSFSVFINTDYNFYHSLSQTIFIRVFFRGQPLKEWVEYEGTGTLFVNHGRDGDGTWNVFHPLGIGIIYCHTQCFKNKFKILRFKPMEFYLFTIYINIFRLRGFYGIVHVDKGETEIVLTEARSGEEQVRWKISSVNRVFCPKTVCKRDKNKILVIITNR